MQKNKPLPIKTPLGQKIILVLFGLFLFLLLLEISLRLGGVMLLSFQDYRNNQAIREKGTYRIMCLGESTTAGEWPPSFKEILNQHNIGIRFSVIDKGVPGTHTSAILAQLEQNLDEYEPDMVVTMMCINDSNPQLSDKDIVAGENISFLRSLKIYRLSRLIYFSVLAKMSALNKVNSLDKNAKKTNVVAPHATLRQISEKIEYSKVENKPREDKIKLDRDEIAARLQAGKAMLEEGRFSEGEMKFQEVLAADPKNLRALVWLGRLYREQGLFLQAEQILKEAIEIEPKEVEACLQLGRLYRDYYQHLDEAEAWFRKAIALQPNCYEGYYELGVLCGNRNKLSEAEAIFKKALALFPDSLEFHFKLGWIFRGENKLSEAEAIFKEALEMSPDDIFILKALASLARETHDYQRAQELDERISVLKSDLHPLTINNYREIAKILKERHVRFVCVQYPVRSIQQLKNIFGEEEPNIIFVDNEKLFKQAVGDYGFKKIFRDMFAGDFGHCTAEGNRLLAENIANAILGEVFQ